MACLFKISQKDSVAPCSPKAKTPSMLRLVARSPFPVLPGSILASPRCLAAILNQGESSRSRRPTVTRGWGGRVMHESEERG